MVPDTLDVDDDYNSDEYPIVQPKWYVVLYEKLFL